MCACVRVRAGGARRAGGRAGVRAGRAAARRRGAAPRQEPSRLPASGPVRYATSLYHTTTSLHIPLHRTTRHTTPHNYTTPRNYNTILHPITHH